MMTKFKQESKEWKKEKGFLFYLELTELQNVTKTIKRFLWFYGGVSSNGRALNKCFVLMKYIDLLNLECHSEKNLLQYKQVK